MHTGALKKWALALTFWLAVHASSLKAQLLGPYGTSPITFEVDANGLLSDTGTYGTGSLSLSGAGTRMFWYPGKAAFRAGYVSGTQWNDSSIGHYSVAFGENTTASGYFSTASGFYSSASGGESTAMGIFASASGGESTAIGAWTSATAVAATALGGGTTASGHYSTAMGDLSTASGNYSTAMGRSAHASGARSTAMGSGTSASASYSTAMGEITTASGYASTASGHYTTASGVNSTATGYETTAGARLSFVIGTFNLGLNSTGGSANATTWEPTDPLFEIGNGGDGYGDGNPAASGPLDAFVVYKNGNVQAQGTMRCSPGGDLSMGSYTTGTAP